MQTQCSVLCRNIREREGALRVGKVWISIHLSSPLVKIKLRPGGGKGASCVSILERRAKAWRHV